MFYIDRIDGKKVLKSTIFKDFEDNFSHFFTTKESYIKTKEESSIKTANSNKKAILSALRLNEYKCFTVHQVHRDNIITKNSCSNVLEEADAIILNKKGTAGYLNFADCTPVILYDPKNKTASIVHAGWRGTVLKIVQKTVLKMKSIHGSNPKNIYAAIGPSIGFCCFEINKDTGYKLKGCIRNAKGLFRENNDKIYADLKNINKEQLLETGVKNIDVTHFCTCCNNDLFFSYRKENSTTDRISAFAMLKNF